ncbi:DNA cytosine methyltransferase [Stieleria sp. TO1_6]|uniref:DNA cytosine methyltransferase n=1 Tax=Stieleria tagensis TaxID=2956795 RepID=UPI00209AE3E7|nr:DNA cytosine methyltransferase [Stieleria tagensis]MCO8124750.1 DNA cytosine methyltransferase [Stieleria tagensis]
MLKAIDFFCGAGGLTRGLLNAGISVVSGFDIDEASKETYEKNNKPSKFHAVDVCALDLGQLRKLTRLRSFSDVVFVGCAPCQPFSQQRKSGPAKHSATLLLGFGRLVQAARPRAVLIENVPGMARVRGYSTFRRFTRLLETLGYKISFDILDAKHFGVPQTRRRLVLVALKDLQPTLPSQVFGTERRPFRTVRDAIEHFPEMEAGEIHENVFNHVTASITEVNLERLRHTPHDGGDRRAWPKRLFLDCHKGDYKGHTDVYGRMAWDQPAPTLTGRCHSISNGRYGHPEQDRAISLREAAALQSFPDRYEFVGTNKHVALQIGNAVPVRFAEYLGRHLVKLLSESRKNTKRSKAA